MKEKFNPYLKILQEKREVYLQIKVQANAKKTELKEILENGIIKISVSAIPEKGKANLVLIKFLCGQFGVHKNQIELISGKSDKNKLVKITNN